MRFCFLFIILFNFSLSPFLQENQEIKKRGDKAFEGFSFDQAIEEYSLIEYQDITTKRNLALSYWKLHQTELAEPLFAEIVKTDSCTSVDIYNYASILRENKKYPEADSWMKNFAQREQEDSRSKLYLSNKGEYQRLIRQNRNFKIKNLDLNSEEQDFCPVFYKNQLVFTSSREGIKPIKRKWNRSGLPFLDIYMTNEDEFNEANPIFGKVNGKYHEGPVAFNPKGDRMIFTRNNYQGKSSKGVTRLQLFSSKLINGKWEQPQPLPFNDNEYSVGHPTISADGRWLYFASNKPGGFGGVDLYKAEIFDKGRFGKPINLGKKINTEGDELFPFIHPKNEMLFFASNGRGGLGGLDIFLAQINKEDQSFRRVSNLGTPVNSNADDFGLILNEDQSKGYFSSNRVGGKGSDDIYSFSLEKPFSFGKIIKGIVRNQSGEILTGATVVLFDLITGEQETLITGDNGVFEFRVEQDKTYNLRGQKRKYIDGTNAVDTHTDQEIIYTTLTLR